MDKETRIWECLESFAFEELNEQDKALVLTMMSEAEYRAQQALLGKLTSISNDSSSEPLPLRLPSRKKVLVLPLYPTLIGTAAVIAFSIFVFRPTSSSTHISLVCASPKMEQVVVRDTVEHTVIKTVRVEVPIEQPLVAEQQPEQPVFSQTRSNDVTQVVNYPKIDERLLNATALSYKNDPSSALLPKINLSNR